VIVDLTLVADGVSDSLYVQKLDVESIFNMISIFTTSLVTTEDSVV
jgi:hypothetical protein